MWCGAPVPGQEGGHRLVRASPVRVGTVLGVCFDALQTMACCGVHTHLLCGMLQHASWWQLQTEQSVRAGGRFQGGCCTGCMALVQTQVAQGPGLLVRVLGCTGGAWPEVAVRCWEAVLWACSSSRVCLCG